MHRKAKNKGVLFARKLNSFCGKENAFFLSIYTLKGCKIMSKEPKNLEQRDGFQSKWGFILACIGSAVGMGNIWRFPIMVQKYGGMTFLLPYFIFVILIGSTGVIEEFALGRRAAAGPVGAFGMCTKERTGSDKSGKAIGAIPIIGALMLAIGYTVVLGWIFKYTFMSLSGSLFSLGYRRYVRYDRTGG